MKKIYLILLMLLLLFIPTSINAVAIYQLDQPIKELNNYTLRQVFDYGNNNISLENQTYRVYLNPTNVNIGDTYYIYGDIILNVGTFAFIIQNTTGVERIFELPNVLSSVHELYGPIDVNKMRVYTDVGSNFDIDINFINMTDYGISSLTVQQMDTYYNLYLEAVRFENENQESRQDIGGYQNIFRSIINGVKNLIIEMGYVWQWLNTPIITSDMQNYSFNIDWSWDLIGVVRQILNSAGILTLQIMFWVPSLAFAFMGIPVQVSILSLLFSNLIFLLLGWIMVKSFLI